MPWWMNAEEINRQHVRLPYAPRDAFRTSHFAREEYRSRLASAPGYLDILEQNALTDLPDLSLIQIDRANQSLDQGFSRLWAGDAPKGFWMSSRRNGTNSPTASASTRAPRLYELSEQAERLTQGYWPSPTCLWSPCPPTQQRLESLQMQNLYRAMGHDRTFKFVLVAGRVHHSADWPLSAGQTGRDVVSGHHHVWHGHQFSGRGPGRLQRRCTPLSLRGTISCLR